MDIFFMFCDSYPTLYLLNGYMCHEQESERDAYLQYSNSNCREPRPTLRRMVCHQVIFQRQQDVCTQAITVDATFSYESRMYIISIST